MLNTQIYEYGSKPENNAGASVGSQVYRYNFGRKDFAEFVEADIPLVSPAMAFPLVQKFELDLAVRHDDYSDFGPTTNPKASFNWDVIDGLRLRGNISTSFVAPPLNLVGGKAGLANFSSVGGSTQSGSIPVSFYPAVTQFGIAGCTTASASCSISSLQGISSSVGDPTAIAQRGRGWSVGADFNPVFLPGFNSAITLWNTSLIGGMTAPQFSARVTTASLVHDLVLYPNCATPAQIAAFAAQAPQSSVFPACVQFTYLSDTSNYLSFYAQGVDVTVGYTLGTDLGTFRIDDNVTEMTKFDEGFAYKTAPTPSQTFSALGTDGFASQFPSVQTQMRAHLGWADMGYLADLYMNFTSAYKNVNGSAVVVPVPNAAGVYSGVGGDHVNANVIFDLHLGYDFNGGVLGDDQISLEVENLANKRPPYFNAANAYDNLVANPIGRMVTLGLAAKL
jgi:iron complex outermembrane receptor protein